MRRAVYALLIVASLCGAEPADARRGLTLGFFDTVFATDEGPTWLGRAHESGGQIVRVQLPWVHVAPVRPAVPADPADPAYRWESVDKTVAAALAARQQVLLSVERAPRWAEGSGRRASAQPGTWKPGPQALGNFMTAAARRYSDRVRHWQVWNEPNLSVHLAPQWERRRGRWVPFAPARYRQLLNAAYFAVKAVDARAVVVTAGTAPYGDPEPGGDRIMPVRFWRNVLVRRTHFDALSHHPYAVAGPRRRALNRDDAAIPDVHKLVKLVKRAVRSGKAAPRRAKRFWVTEVSWDSRPPDPDGVPAARHAAWLADAFYVLWKQGVDTITWFQIRDQEPRPSFGATNQSGIFLRDGRPKIAARAFAFPFACDRPRRGRMRVWLKAPASGRVTIADSNGRMLGALHAGRNRIAYGTVRPGKRPRATMGDRASIACVPS